MSLQDTGVPTLEGDATSESTLRAARIDKAHGLISSLNDDAQNVATVLTARSVNPTLSIVARATGENAERRIVQAGADRVVNPYRLGGVRLASLLVHPTAVGLFDAMLQQGDLRFDHTVVPSDSPLVGQSLQAASLAVQWRVSVISIQRGEEIIAFPPPTFEIHAGDILLVLGNRERIRTFTKKNA